MSKHLDTIRARCALLGIVLADTEDDRGQPLFVATRWAIIRSISSFKDLEDWLDKLTKRAA